MISRRNALKMAAVACAASSAPMAAATPLPAYDILARPWPLAPSSRLVWAKHVWRVRNAVKHEWHFPPSRGGYSYAGDGWRYETPDPDARVFGYHHIHGYGDTAVEAIDTWYWHLPEGPIETLIWRAEPELTSEFDFDTKTTRWHVYSRFAIVPPPTDA